MGELEHKLESISTQHSSENKQNISKMQLIIDDLQSKVSKSSSGAVIRHENDLAKIQDKLDDLENRSRRSNLLFYGVTDTDGSESWEASERIVKEICSNNLGISVSSVARAHRLGCFSSDKKRPIIAKFYNEKEVESILSKGYKLKNTTISVSRDYSEAVRDKRRKLLQFSRGLRKNGDRVRLVFNKLFINDDAYMWDTESNTATKPSRRNTAWRKSNVHPPVFSNHPSESDALSSNVHDHERGLSFPYTNTGSILRKRNKKRSTGTPVVKVSSTKSSHEITFANVNARSIVNKLDDLESLLISLKPDFLAVTETWLTSDIEDFFLFYLFINTAV